MIDETIINEWFGLTDCHGVQLIKEEEHDFIRNRISQLSDLQIVSGDIDTDLPSAIVIDITHLKPDGFQANKNVHITLSHFIRPCYCKDCEHESQYECYLNDCNCCTGDCT